jgi:hypothetical protein
MRHCSLLLFILLLTAMPVDGQSLHLKDGERAVEASGSWSVGPSSRGFEGSAGASLDGRIDVGLTIGRYTYEFDDGSKSTFKEYAPFVRWFPVKEQEDGAPVGLAVSGQIFLDDYGTDDSGRYVQLGTTVFKELKLSDRFSMQPFIGFGFVAESYAFGGGPAERAQYLTRDLGLHFTTPTDRPWFLRMTLSEQSFRRETYRGARVSVVRRL